MTESRIDATYQGLTTQLHRRYRQGLAFQIAYTLGKAEDVAGSSQDVTDPASETGPANHDVRHVVKLNALWEIPFASEVKALEYLLGGWQVNAIAVYQSGPPFSVVCGLTYPQCDFNADGQTNDRVNVSRTDLGSLSQDEWLSGVLTDADYTLPAQGTLATQERNAFRGPSYFNTDLSLFKNIRTRWFNGGGSTLQLRVEAFNIFNRAHLSMVTNQNTPQIATNSPTFGRVTNLRNGTLPRVIQLGVKFVF